jgi:SAM-dependent methyltransferase
MGARPDRVTASTHRAFEYLWRWQGTDTSLYGRALADAVNALLEKTNLTPADLRGRLVLDAGAGSGALTAALADLGAHVVGLDLVAPPAHDLARARRYTHVQGDLRQLPFVRGAFDVCLCVGVLHHVPDDAACAGELARVTDPHDGVVAIWVYDRDRARGVALDDALRSVTSRMTPPTLRRVAGILAPAYPWIRRAQGAEPRPIPPPHRARIIYDWLKPPYRRFYRDHELTACMARHGWTPSRRSAHRLGITFVPESSRQETRS